MRDESVGLALMFAIAEWWIVAMRCRGETLRLKHEVRSLLSALSLLSQIFWLMRWLNRARIALSNKFNSNSVIATLMSLEEPFKTLSEGTIRTRLGLLWHHIPPFDLAYDILRGVLQLVIASFLPMLMTGCPGESYRHI